MAHSPQNEAISHTQAQLRWLLCLTVQAWVKVEVWCGNSEGLEANLPEPRSFLGCWKSAKTTTRSQRPLPVEPSASWLRARHEFPCSYVPIWRRPSRRGCVLGPDQIIQQDESPSTLRCRVWQVSWAHFSDRDAILWIASIACLALACWYASATASLHCPMVLLHVQHRSAFLVRLDNPWPLPFGPVPCTDPSRPYTSFCPGMPIVDS